MDFKSICVFCGSSPGFDGIYGEKAREFGELLAKKNITLVFGGGKVGLMGIIANSVLNAGGHCVGVMPQRIVSMEIAHQDLSEMHIVETMAERKSRMVELSDAFVAFPGGLGTLDELSEILTINQLRIIDKPIGLLNVKRYFDNLIKFIGQGVSEGFIREEHADNLIIADEPLELLEKLKEFRPVNIEKWILEIKQEIEGNRFSG